MNTAMFKMCIRDSPNGDGAVLEINFIQQNPVFHLVLRMPGDQLALQLELDDGNGLVHLCRQRDIHRVVGVFVQNVRGEDGAGVCLLYTSRCV